MTNLSLAVNNEQKQSNQKVEYVKADINNGYYRIANELGLALCKTHLSDYQSRVLEAVKVKTFGFNKSMDWISNEQLSELTNIPENHVSTVKTSLFSRKILIKNGRKIGFNTIVSEWIKNPKLLKQGENKTPQVRSRNSLNKESKLPKQGVITPQTRVYKRQDTITKDTITKDISKPPQKKPLDFSGWKSKPSEQTLKDWLAMRKLKKAPVSQTVINRFCTEINIAFEHGMSADDVLGECVVRGWQGFKYQWLQNSNNIQNNSFSRKLTVAEHNEKVKQDWLNSQRSEYNGAIDHE